MVSKMMKSCLYLEIAQKNRFFIKSAFGLVRKVISLVSVICIEDLHFIANVVVITTREFVSIVFVNKEMAPTKMRPDGDALVNYS